MRLTRKRSRTGFSLIELLAVIAIIGILVGLVAYGVSKVIGSQRRNNTEEAMSTIQKTLAHHWAYVVSEARKETGLEVPYNAIDALFGADTSGGERNRVIWIKMRLMEAFPTSYDEITKATTNLFPYSKNIIPSNMRKNIGTYQSKLKPTKPPTPASESSACLLLALSTSRGGTSLDKEALGASNVYDSDGDGMDEFVDSWGTPLTFFRFPTYYKALQDSNPASGTAKAAKYCDPVDPTGALFQWAASLGWGTAPVAQFETNVHLIGSPFYLSGKNPTKACYVLPTVVSSGPDTKLGLLTTIAKNMAIDPLNAADEADNLYTFKLRPGAGEEFR